jgi:hypothetical protein
MNDKNFWIYIDVLNLIDKYLSLFLHQKMSLDYCLLSILFENIDYAWICFGVRFVAKSVQ